MYYATEIPHLKFPDRFLNFVGQFFNLAPLSVSGPAESHSAACVRSRCCRFSHSSCRAACRACPPAALASPARGVKFTFSTLLFHSVSVHLSGSQRGILCVLSSVDPCYIIGMLCAGRDGAQCCHILKRWTLCGADEGLTGRWTVCIRASVILADVMAILTIFDSVDICFSYKSKTFSEVPSSLLTKSWGKDVSESGYLQFNNIKSDLSFESIRLLWLWKFHFLYEETRPLLFPSVEQWAM